MRIVSIDRFHAPHGGKERYQFELSELLTRHGHVVIPFALAETGNISGPFDSYFAPALPVQSHDLGKRVGAALSRAWNRDSARALTRLIDDTRPDVAHIHCLHHLSISVVRTLRRRGIPIVFTLHDYQLICPVATLFRDGSVCEECRPHRYYRAVTNRCSHGQLTNSVAGMLDASVTWLSGELAGIQMFIAPSRFIKNKFVEFGHDAGRITHVPHFAPTDKWRREPMPGAGPIVFAGRLQRLKGAHVLLDAASQLDLPAAQQIVIIGDGPERAALQAQAGRLRVGQVHFTGHLDHTAIRDWYRRSLFAVVPSIWHEVLGFAVLEPFAIGRPVIGARTGGIPEVIEDGVSGRLVQPGNSASLAGAIDWMLSHPIDAERMGRAARDRAETAFGPEAHYNSLLEIYVNAVRR